MRYIKKIKDVILNDVFIQMLQSEWCVCTASLTVAHYHLYF
jgi:hypothetical protein